MLAKLAKQKFLKAQKLIKNIKVAVQATNDEKELGSAFELRKYFILSLRDHTAQKYLKAKKATRDRGTCGICGEPITDDIQAIHKLGYERKDIALVALQKCNNDLDEAKIEYHEYHLTHAVVAIGCKPCHYKYDSKDPEIFVDIADEHFKTLTQHNA
jgi:hypothetical protein